MNLIDYGISEGIATLKLNSPHNLNALNESMLSALINALTLCDDDSNVRVIVITGIGKGFSGGGDIAAMVKSVKSGEDNIESSLTKLKEAALKIRRVTKPIIASVHGPVAGAGFNLALLCDFRIAADNSRFIQAFVNIGLIPDMAGILSLTRILGVSRATELIMTGRQLAADEAYSMGFVNKVVPVESLEAATLELARTLSKKPSVSLATMKALMNKLVYDDLEASLTEESLCQIACAKTEDFVEGITAFIEKREPHFTGR